MAVEFLVVLPIDPMPIGAAYPRGASLPLHCTLMQWFWIQKETDFARLHHQLAVLASNTPIGEIELVSEAPALFGPQSDVPVHVLKHNERLNVLHTKLLVFLAAHTSAPEAYPWIGAGYRPHVTTARSAFVPGSRHVPESLVLIERDAEKNQIVRRMYALGKTPSLV
ncbi:MAG TPA: hypothetical protein VMU25_02520 [Candidatus Paceibacterota bacterium]|nr:hypothetical protein [Candidatus Paceibacterota bacterium]